MKYVPHDYQTYATDFILNHPVAANLLQMGLGKSVITLTAIRKLLERGEISRVLVVAPLRVARDTWPEEIRKWDHLRGLTYAVAVGSAAERKAALQKDVQIHIINRENLCWLAESGMKLSWDMIVIDELSSFKSWQSKRFRAMLRLRTKVERIVGLTGTPTGNGLMDLFAEYRVLDRGERLGRFIGRYREAYFLPDKRSAQQVFTWKIRPGAEEEIYRKIADITVSMKSVDFLKMPECLMNTVKVRMDAEERKKYETLKENLFLQLSFSECSMTEGPKGFQGALAPRSPVETVSRGKRQIYGKPSKKNSLTRRTPPPSAGSFPSWPTAPAIRRTEPSPGSTTGSWMPWRT